MKTFAKTDIGKARDMNQDYYYVSRPEDEIQLYIIADGMGGYNGGEIASSLAVNSIKSYIQSNYQETPKDKVSLPELIRSSIEYANMVIYEKSKENDDLQIESIDGNMIDMIDGVAFENDQQMTYISSGVVCSLYSNDLTSQEKLAVLSSMQSSQVK